MRYKIAQKKKEGVQNCTINKDREKSAIKTCFL